jgi:hypothetical protein
MNSSQSTSDQSLKNQSVFVPSLSEAFWFWLKLGFISFGGPAGQIATMHQELVERKKWISEENFLHALNYCMLLPGPEAQQLATYLGWLMHRTWGGVIAPHNIFVNCCLFDYFYSFTCVESPFSIGDTGCSNRRTDSLQSQTKQDGRN